MKTNKQFAKVFYKQAKELLENDKPYMVYPLEKEFIVDEQTGLVFVRLQFIHFIQQIQQFYNINMDDFSNQLEISHRAITNMSDHLHDTDNWFTYFDDIYVRIEEQMFEALDDWLHRQMEKWSRSIRQEAIQNLTIKQNN